jgi:hypothetical protein
MTSYMVHGVAEILDVRFVQHEEDMGWIQLKFRSDNGSTHEVTLFNSGNAALFEEFQSAVKAAEVQP